VRGVAAAIVVAVLATAAVAAGPRPSLHLVASKPRVVVRGVSFKPRELVTVRLTGKGTSTALVRASLYGAFRASLVPPPPLACGGRLLRATGSKGSTAFLRIGPLECNPPSGVNG
jgi:hypothetical protein